MFIISFLSWMCLLYFKQVRSYGQEASPFNKKWEKYKLIRIHFHNRLKYENFCDYEWRFKRKYKNSEGRMESNAVLRRKQIFIFNRKEMVHVHTHYYPYTPPPPCKQTWGVWPSDHVFFIYLRIWTSLNMLSLPHILLFL